MNACTECFTFEFKYILFEVWIHLVVGWFMCVFVKIPHSQQMFLLFSQRVFVTIKYSHTFHFTCICVSHKIQLWIFFMILFFLIKFLQEKKWLIRAKNILKKCIFKSFVDDDNNETTQKRSNEKKENRSFFLFLFSPVSLSLRFPRRVMLA